MNAARSKKRKLLWALLGLAVLLVLAVALLPVWFPWVLRPVARQAGVDWKYYEAKGYTRAILHGLSGEFGEVKLSADRAQLFLPNRWIWRRFFGGKEKESHVYVTNWRLEIPPGEQEPELESESSTNSLTAILNQVDSLLPTCRTWLPWVQLTNGVLALPGQEISVSEAVWRNGTLTITAASTNLAQSLSLTGDFSASAKHTVSVELNPIGLAAEIQLHRPATEWDLAGGLEWQKNRVELAAHFGAKCIMPEQASLLANEVRLPAELLALEGYEEPRGSFELKWLTSQFTFHAGAELIPIQSNTLSTPKLAIKLRGHGDLESVTVDQLETTAPWGNGRLASSLGVNLADQTLAKPTELRLALDLSALSLTNTAGQLDGVLRVEPRGTNLPQVNFTITGQNLLASDISAQRLSLGGQLKWPLLVLQSAELQFDQDSVLAASATLDFGTRALTNGQWEFKGGGAVPRQLLPKNLSYATLVATGTFQGPIDQPMHTGRISVTGLNVPSMHVCDVQLDWSGTLLDLNKVDLAVQTENTGLRANGALRTSLANGSRIEFELNRLDWLQNGKQLYQLDRPARLIARQPGRASDSSDWEFTIGGWQWSGKNRGLRLAADVDWPPRGVIHVDAQAVEFDHFSGLFQLPLTNVVIEALDCDVEWNAGPADWNLNLTAQVPGPEAEPVTIFARLQGNAKGIAIQPLRLHADLVPTLTIEGAVPLIVMPTNISKPVQLSQDIPFNVRVRSAPTANYTREFGSAGQLILGKPKLELDLVGILNDLEGNLNLQLARAAWLPKTNTASIPSLEHIKVAARLREELLELSELSMQVNGQPVLASGEWPLGSAVWDDLLAAGKWPDWKQARARIEIAHADVAALGQQFVTNLISQGQISLVGGVEPGGIVRGKIQLTNVVTAPLPPLGIIRDVAASIHLEERIADLLWLTGRVGNAHVAMQGRVDLADFNDPQFEVTLTSSNAPLVRKPEIIVRSDLNLRLVSSSNQPPTFSGHVRMRDSIFMQKLELLAPRPDTGSGLLFPFFKVETPPLKDWKLNVVIAGDRFMRIRTPLFIGQASADFNLSGQLGDPIALGEARINSGRIMFPFGRLNLDSGFVTVSSDAPHRPRLSVVASGSRYGYEINMEINGPADDPQVIMTSTPPLNSEQIIRLLTTGELPNNPSHFSDQDRMLKGAMFYTKDLIARISGNESSKERLIIDSGERISEGGKSTYVIEYKLTDDWSLVGEYDRFDSLNAYVKWRFYSR